MDLMLNVNSPRKYREKYFFLNIPRPSRYIPKTSHLRYINPYLGLLYFLDVTGKKWHDTLP